MPPMPASTDLLEFLRMVHKLVDDKRGRELLGLLADSLKSNERSTAALQAERAGLAAARAQHEQSLRAERAEHERLMKAERAAWASERAARLGEVERTEAQAKEVLARAKTVEANALAVRRDLQQRLARMNELAA
jgi:hypothetical protein